MRDSLFYKELYRQVEHLGGYHNAHLHLDRAYTEVAELHKSGSAGHLSLQEKHQRISAFHAGEFYTNENLASRLRHSLTNMAQQQTRRADSVIDTTNDGLGLRALEVAKGVSEEFAGTIDFRIAAYSPLGFREDDPERWDLIEAGAEIAHFIGCLPERDDTTRYPDHIGYVETCLRMIDLANRHKTFLHVHTDQMNSSKECGTEMLLDALEQDNPFRQGETQVWAIHMISPAAYPEDRWNSLVARLKTQNVGVICCPSGALGMRQLRHENAPTHNSIARVLELSQAGVAVRLGSDNCADMLSPSTTTDLTDEVFLLSAAIRFYDVEILAHLACGKALKEEHRARISEHLEQTSA